MVLAVGVGKDGRQGTQRQATQTRHSGDHYPGDQISSGHAGSAKGCPGLCPDLIVLGKDWQAEGLLPKNV